MFAGEGGVAPRLPIVSAALLDSDGMTGAVWEREFAPSSSHRNLKSRRTSPNVHVASLRPRVSEETVVENKEKRSTFTISAVVDVFSDSKRR